jgi:ATP-dependent RNA circularization protein (DNA/RNA ligase family)
VSFCRSASIAARFFARSSNSFRTSRRITRVFSSYQEQSKNRVRQFGEYLGVASLSAVRAVAFQLVTRDLSGVGVSITLCLGQKVRVTKTFNDFDGLDPQI